MRLCRSSRHLAFLLSRYRDCTERGRAHRRWVLSMRRVWQWLARPIEGVAPAGQGRDGSELSSRLSCAFSAWRVG